MEPKRPLPEALRFFSDTAEATMFVFPKDMDRLPAEVNRLNNQVLVHTYEDEWRRWN
jgi:spermidine synthase